MNKKPTSFIKFNMFNLTIYWIIIILDTDKSFIIELLNSIVIYISESKMFNFE